MAIPASHTQVLLLETSETPSLAAADPCQPTVSTLLHDLIAKARVPLRPSDRAFQCPYLIISPSRLLSPQKPLSSSRFLPFPQPTTYLFPLAWAPSWDKEGDLRCLGEPGTQNQAFLIRVCLLCSGLPQPSGQLGR